MNVEVVDGVVGAKTDFQKLTASLKQGSAQLLKTIGESFKLLQTEFEIQYEDTVGPEQEETP